MLGEIRDAAVASLAVQAALSGHRLVATLHAASPAGAIARLLEMGIEPYQVSSAVFGVVAQRLLRRKTDAGGYKGRLPVAEFTRITAPLRQAILNRGDADTLAQLIRAQPEHQTLREAAQSLVDQQLTDAAELVRVIGA
jgi:type II secretory ATPase GspE/PulE/Tfp pilus assembly ATPase PilB-like protein